MSIKNMNIFVNKYKTYLTNLFMKVIDIFRHLASLNNECIDNINKWMHEKWHIKRYMKIAHKLVHEKWWHINVR